MKTATCSFPSVAVVISVDNPGARLFRSVLSTLWQLEAGDELIVVADRVGELPDYPRLRKYAKRITWFERKGRTGVAADAELAVRHAKAEWLKPLDASDVLAPFALQVLRRATPPLPDDVHVLVGGHYLVAGDRFAGAAGHPEALLASGLAGNDLPASAAFVRRRALHQVRNGMRRPLTSARMHRLLTSAPTRGAGCVTEDRWAVWRQLQDRHGEGCFATTLAPVCYRSLESGRRSGSTQSLRHAGLRSASSGILLRRSLFRPAPGRVPSP